MISVVTPVFNRKLDVLRSINSSLELLRNNVVEEIIVVDDASIDGSYESVLIEFREEIDAGSVKLYRIDKNVGVTGAKNLGAGRATGTYIGGGRECGRDKGGGEV